MNTVKSNNFLYNINFDSNDLSNQLIKLLVFTNNYFKYNQEYIKEKYNINDYSEFRNYFKKNYKLKLIFNSIKSEKLFINFINLDYNYFNTKYKNYELETIFNFFITGKLFFFNKCNEINKNLKEKTHFNNCDCKIKVKSIANLSISSLIFILKEFFSNYNDNVTKSTISKEKKIIKVSKNNNNKDLISCIDKLEIAESNLGINCDIETQYVLNSSTDNNTVSKKNKKFYFKHDSISSNESDHILDHFDNYSLDNSNKIIYTFLQNNFNKKFNHETPLYNTNPNLNDILIKQFDSDIIDLDTKIIHKNNILDDIAKNNITENNITENNITENNIAKNNIIDYITENAENNITEDDEDNITEDDEDSSIEITDSTSSEKIEEHINLSKCMEIILDYLDINNNKLVENEESITKLAIELKKNIKLIHSEELANKFDKIFQRSLIIKTISDTDDMKEYYDLHKSLINIKKKL